MLDAARDELRITLRALRRSPALALIVIAMFAFGIGANATMFGIIDRILLRPPPHIRQPEQLVELAATWRNPTGDATQKSFGYPVYRALQGGLRDIADVAVMDLTGQFTVGRGESARGVKAQLVSGTYWQVLGVSPAVGRFFGDDEDRLPVGDPVAVIGYGYWQRYFGGRPDALGQTLDIGTRRYAIVGVAPKGFTGTELGAIDVWLPISSAEGLRFAGADWATTRRSTWLRIIARPHAGVGLAQLQGRATPINLAEGEARMASMRATIAAIPFLNSIRDEQSGGSATVARLLAIVSTLVVLIACANVANLLLVRAVQRRREIAIRLALGVSRARLTASLLSESCLLASLGGIAAVAVASWGGSAARVLLFGDIEWVDSPIDARVLAYTGFITLLTGVLAGLAPLGQAFRFTLADALRAGARHGGAERTRVRSVLLVTQAALAGVLLVGTGLFARSLHRVTSLPIGMEPDRVLLGRMDLRQTGRAMPEVDALVRQMRARVRGLGGIENAAVAVTVAGLGSWGGQISIPGIDSLPSTAGGPFFNAVESGFFATMGIRFVRGRSFTDAEEQSGARVLVVNETLARAAWPNDNPIGQCVRVGADTAPCSEVVGVIENTRRQDWIEDDIYHVHLPLSSATASMRQRVLVVRPSGRNPQQMTEPVRRAMQTTAPNLAFASVTPLTARFASELRPWKLGAAMFGAFGALAVVLAALGVYAVVSFTVSQRTHEIGVRMALGAQRWNVVRLVMRQGVTLAAIGAALGIFAAGVSARIVAPLLFQVSPRDPLVFGAAATTLVLVAVAATLVPARRAAGVSPIVALRSDE